MDITDEDLEKIEKELARSAVVRWEYRQVDLNEAQGYHFDIVMNGHGADGWEAYSILPTSDVWRIRVFFKRRRQ